MSCGPQQQQQQQQQQHVQQWQRDCFTSTTFDIKNVKNKIQVAQVVFNQLFRYTAEKNYSYKLLIF